MWYDVTQVMSSKDYTIILGMPGTGELLVNLMASLERYPDFSSLVCMYVCMYIQLCL